MSRAASRCSTTRGSSSASGRGARSTPGLRPCGRHPGEEHRTPAAPPGTAVVPDLRRIAPPGTGRSRRVDRHDVLDLLEAQHGELERLLGRVRASTGERCRQAWTELRDLLERHEATEERVLRPLTGRTRDGEEIARVRRREEGDAQQLVRRMAPLDVDSPGVGALAIELQTVLLAHMEAEEVDEFPLLRRTVDLDTLRAAREDAERAEFPTAGRRARGFRRR